MCNFRGGPSSPSALFWSLFQGTACIGSPFPFITSVVWMYRSFLITSVEENVGCFQFGVIMKKTAVTIHG